MKIWQNDICKANEALGVAALFVEFIIIAILCGVLAGG